MRLVAVLADLVWFNEQSERKPITIPAAGGKDSAVVAIAKDWLAGGTAAGVSKTIVAPIGTQAYENSLHALKQFFCDGQPVSDDYRRLCSN